MKTACLIFGALVSWRVHVLEFAQILVFAGKWLEEPALTLTASEHLIDVFFIYHTLALAWLQASLLLLLLNLFFLILVLLLGFAPDL